MIGRVEWVLIGCLNRVCGCVSTYEGRADGARLEEIGMIGYVDRMS